MSGRSVSPRAGAGAGAGTGLGRMDEDGGTVAFAVDEDDEEKLPIVPK